VVSSEIPLLTCFNGRDTIFLVLSCRPAPQERRLPAGRFFYSILRLKQSLAGGQSTEPVSATRLAPVSRQGFAPQILAEQFTHFIRELL
jgi:hypothetical protein